MSVKVKAYGKLNLNLNVTGAYGDSYHSLSSVVTTVSVFDTVTLSRRQDNEINLSLLGSAFGGKTAQDVAKAIVSNFSVTGADISVVKGVPLCGGMGGSSAAAAGVIAGMAALYNLPIDKKMLEIAARQGSDIAYLTAGGLALLQGKGDDVTYYDFTKTLHFTLIEGEPMLTKDVFAAFDKMPDHTFFDGEKLVRSLFEGNIKSAQKYLGNNLQSAAVRLNGKLKEIINACGKLCLPAPVMTGSGGNFFILCQSQEDAEYNAQKLKDEGFNSYALKSTPRAIEIN